MTSSWNLRHFFIRRGQVYALDSHNNQQFADNYLTIYVELYTASSKSTSSATFALGEGNNYWEKVGRESDKAGRQLSAYFDLNTLDENRAKAAEMKVARQQGRDPYSKGKTTKDWNNYKKEKKQKKLKMNLQRSGDCL